MIAITKTTFRNQMKHFLELAKTERVIIGEGNECFEIVPRAKIMDNDMDNPVFVAKLAEALKQIENGECFKVEKNDIHNFVHGTGGGE